MMCSHNQRTRYTHGFLCEDCDTFFSESTTTYRSTELLSTLWMVLNNIHVEVHRRDGVGVPKALLLRNKIGIGIEHEDFEDLIKEAESIMYEYGYTKDSAQVRIS